MAWNLLMASEYEFPWLAVDRCLLTPYRTAIAPFPETRQALASLSVSVSVAMSVSVSVSLSVCLSLSLCLSVCLSVLGV